MGSNAWAAIRHMEDLLPMARAAGIPVVYSRHYFRVSTGLALSDPASPYSELNPLSEIQDEIAMQPGDLLVDKQQASVFHQTGLINMLMNKGVDNIIVTGNSTSGCVHATVVDAGGYQLKVSIVEDAVFDRFDLSHAAALFNMGSKYGDIVSIGEVYEYVASIEDGERVPA
jgi:nicotinamidase-related amidase